MQKQRISFTSNKLHSNWKCPVRYESTGLTFNLKVLKGISPTQIIQLYILPYLNPTKEGTVTSSDTNTTLANKTSTDFPVTAD